MQPCLRNRRVGGVARPDALGRAWSRSIRPRPSTRLRACHPKTFAYFGTELRRGGGHSGYERLQVLAADRVLQLGDRFGFDLPDTFAGNLKDPANFFERVGVAVGQTVPQADNFPLAERQRLEQLFDSLAQKAVVGQLVRGFGALVLDELAEAAV